MALFLEELLEGDRVLFNLGDDDVSVSGRLLRPDQDKVPILDVGVDHGIAADAQDISISRGSEQVRDRHALRRVLICLDRTAGRDLADDRQHVRFRSCGLGHQFARETQAQCGERCEAQGARLGSAALEVALSLEHLEVVMNCRRGRQIDSHGNLSDGGRVAARPQGGRDEVQDLALTFGVVLRHGRLLSLARSIQNARSLVKRTSGCRRYADRFQDCLSSGV